MKLDSLPEFRLQVLQDSLASFIAVNHLTQVAIDGHRAQHALEWFADCNDFVRRANHTRRIMGWPPRPNPGLDRFNIKICWYNEPRSSLADVEVVAAMPDLGRKILGLIDHNRIATANKMRLRIVGPHSLSKDFLWDLQVGIP